MTMLNRQPFQILALPYIILSSGVIEFALFKRTDGNYWQGIAGGGEHSETPLEAAKRESFEEANITSGEFLELLSRGNLPAEHVAGFLWGPSIFIIPEYSFGIKLANKADLKLSHEHKELGWFSFDEAYKLLKWDTNKTALWELNYRLTCVDIDVTQNQSLLLGQISK